jgi:hypothetical protein
LARARSPNSGLGHIDQFGSLRLDQAADPGQLAEPNHPIGPNLERRRFHSGRPEVSEGITTRTSALHARGSFGFGARRRIEAATSIAFANIERRVICAEPQSPVLQP